MKKAKLDAASRTFNTAVGDFINAITEYVTGSAADGDGDDDQVEKPNPVVAKKTRVRRVPDEVDLGNFVCPGNVLTGEACISTAEEYQRADKYRKWNNGTIQMCVKCDGVYNVMKRRKGDRERKAKTKAKVAKVPSDAEEEANGEETIINGGGAGAAAVAATMKITPAVPMGEEEML